MSTIIDKHPLLHDYLTASGKYPEREHHSELTDALIDNANMLLWRLQELFEELGLNLYDYKFSSGFRPKAVNANTPNAATHSLHSDCLALDIIDDKNQTLAKIMQSLKARNIRKKLGIWLESPKHTIGKITNWVHLDLSTLRAIRDSMEFIP